MFSFGEGVFGNQLVVVNNRESVFLLDHENADCHDLLVCPRELLAIVLEHGIDWIDFYSDGSLNVARQHGAVSEDLHLHWLTPLNLNGRVSLNNLAPLEREPHLVGHADIWRQIRGLPPGTTVIPR